MQAIWVVGPRVGNLAFTIAGWSSSVARWAHNPEVAGSNPVPATKSPGQRHLASGLALFSGAEVRISSVFMARADGHASRGFARRAPRSLLSLRPRDETFPG